MNTFDKLIKRFSFVDVFVSEKYNGNKCAVVELNNFIPDFQMQLIASEFGVPATTFLIQYENIWFIRWFSKSSEIEFCGHGTIAAASFLSQSNIELNYFEFTGSSRIITVSKRNNFFEMSLPIIDYSPIDMSDSIKSILKIEKIVSIYRANNGVILVELEMEEDVLHFYPEEKLLINEKATLVITTKGKNSDYVLRYFAPSYGEKEDDATGSVQALLAPFWSKKLKKNNLSAIQLSERGGAIFCQCMNDVVIVSGECRY